MDYKNKIVVVTGAARGIGQATAKEYARAGARVILADVLAEPQEATVSELRAAGLEAYAYKCDVSSDEQVAQFAAAVQREVGVPDIVHNNAVMIRSGGIVDLDVESIRRQLDVNVLGYLRVTKAFLPAMIERKSGWIAITASPNGLNPPPIVSGNMLAYCLSKAAGVSMAQCMAVSLKPLGIGVSVLFPDVTYTESVEELSGTASPEFHHGFRHFIRNESRSADVVAKNLVEGLKTAKFFVNAYPGWPDALAAWATHDLDPQLDWMEVTQKSKI